MCEVEYKAHYRLAALKELLAKSPQYHWYEPITESLDDYFAGHANSDIATHLRVIAPWLHLRAKVQCLDEAVVNLQASPYTSIDKAVMKASLLALHPWRKGPFSLFGIEIDAEWKANLKWDRIHPTLTRHGILGKKILDVGAGNGYYMLRLLGAGADFVLGLDPSIHCMAQFLLIAGWLRRPLWLVPAKLEAMPIAGEFDWVLSMGVLSHARQPEQHLRLLKSKVAKDGGRLLLETLVVPETVGEALVPTDRYAGMRNIWQLPSVSGALNWLKAAGFRQAEWIRSDPTTPKEQRTTEWMRFKSLTEWLDPKDPSRTIEGYPAPLRAIFIAKP